MRFQRLFAALKRPITTFLATSLAAAPLWATWSIAVMNVKTGEVVAAGATCIENGNVITFITSVVTGKGAGHSQAAVYHGGKVRIFEGLNADLTPQEIMDNIFAGAANLQSRQFGVVGLNGPPVTFTGSNNGNAALGMAGSVGDLRYSIQGNVLAGDSVVQAAVASLEASEGDLGQRVMLAMEAAAEQGGDGRCSCGTGTADGCGAPPPNFTHTAYTSYILIARHGDTDSLTCGNGSANCSNGDYYARITNTGGPADLDPIIRLRRQYNQWRVEHAGRADHLLSEVYSTDQLVQADGLDSTEIDVALVDIDGNPITVGGQTLLATAVEDPGVTISSVTDNGDGTFHLSVLGGNAPGHARIRLVVQDGVRDVQLSPDVEFDVVTPSDLFANRSVLSASQDQQISFDLRDAANPGGGFHLFGSASGTSPGTPWGTLTLPLNRDRLFDFTALAPDGAGLVNTMGVLDGAGESSAWISFRSGALQNYVGGHFDFVAYLPGSPDRVSQVVGMDVVP